MNDTAQFSAINIGQSKDLPLSLQVIINSIYRHQQNMKPSLARKIVLEADVKAKELISWKTYNHPLVDSYGQKLVFKANFFEIAVMS